jgi:Leucine-rich repeat (LRR) protein
VGLVQIGFVEEGILDVALSSLTGLQFLSLADNFLERVATSVAAMSALIALDLASNQLTRLPEGSFLANIEALDLRGNRLEGFPFTVRHGFPYN